MRKILLNLVLLSLFIPFLISAQIDKPLNCCKIIKEITVEGTIYREGRTVGSETKCDLTGATPNHTDKKWTLICLLSAVTLVTDWVFIFAMSLVGLMIIIGIYHIVTAAGFPEKANKGKNYIMFALIGMVLALFSKGIPDLVEILLGI